jgi:hypothetical protein
VLVELVVVEVAVPLELVEPVELEEHLESRQHSILGSFGQRYRLLVIGGRQLMVAD